MTRTGSERANGVDSAARLAYFAAEPTAAEFAAAVDDTARRVVPAVCLLDVRGSARVTPRSAAH